MNLANKPRNELLFVNFNQDYTCISVGTKQGYKMYNCDPFAKCYGRFEGGTGIVEMLFCTSLVALVGAGAHPAFSPRRLQIANTKRQSTICELNFVNKILAVKMNRKRLVVVLEDRIHIYDITNMKILHTVDTAANPRGICALSPNSDSNYLAYPASHTDGNVLMFDALNMQASSVMQAHKGPVTCLAFNYSGSMLATSSEKGTVIRVFSVPDAKKLYQFRRGSYPATIYSINFSVDSTRLCVSSSSDTVHIFNLGQEPRQNSGASSSKGGAFSLSSYLPEMLTEMWDPERHFAHFKLPNAGNDVMNVCALSSTLPQAMVVTADGNFYQYQIPKDGGECTLVKQYSILDPSEGKTSRTAASDSPDVGSLADPTA
ncbi:WD repeat domain phosphoinositide-interacting protein 2 [Capsaspora owczarzaki ATCC 30864]|uniref:WD repeat domain phosphoinositide-interacting protein 2 n=1 Tax=Capsaspora owczarzaki (strain ATCC 30864) TaxID=595528 RepID=A0A0D2WUL0_CAPO3|nr:WD repeat domain phosphoinositide-interacting protein 2 [Capsaspora owczarzaki ATCC 30864]KJE95663.1 WD repeat domain phosphoinositide-interacting protein 2 [Capsaspora owczarzaki ATCC 30864]|eukprot:XP_004345680.2 WD repeat domain phosphoinositide-interacting protein 2 [Capsaspora owczarzaki ATCC 30864]